MGRRNLFAGRLNGSRSAQNNPAHCKPAMGKPPLKVSEGGQRFEGLPECLQRN
jgi:hypothetical protein